jgi:hypothetical protein
MERQNTSRLFLLPALALGLIVAWASYAGTETSIEEMSSSVGAGSWEQKQCCKSETQYNCTARSGYSCPSNVYHYGTSSGDENPLNEYAYSGDYCGEQNSGCANHGCIRCASSTPPLP